MTHTLMVDQATSQRLARVRQAGTSVELIVHEFLRSFGVRRVRHGLQLPGRPDFSSTKERWSIFVHGCFWHSHEGCRRATIPRRNRAFWIEKFKANRDRDLRVLRRIRRLGFGALVLWECDLIERPNVMRARVKNFLSRRRAKLAKLSACELNGYSLRESRSLA